MEMVEYDGKEKTRMIGTGIRIRRGSEMMDNGSVGACVEGVDIETC